ncbi:MAG: hypothetical protein CVT49_07065 [candidate division Zixibacteria bacterium HGW-Zixibacteria-1]|nr:MAG: hypothetical protein CVT49_07065 [candidate division Zixibacteria bacterium HGW-Zixibacteria-1]
MKSRFLVSINPELLRWARESIGLSQSEAAQKINRISVGKLASWEKGESSPSIIQLRKISDVYKRPLAAFYLQSPPKDFRIIQDYRLSPFKTNIEASPELLLSTRNAELKREEAIEIAEVLGNKIQIFNKTTTMESDIDNLANEIRKYLNIDIEIQKKWRNSYIAFKNWKNVLESKDILIFQTSGISEQEMSGFSISATQYPVISVNGRNAYSRRVFTLFHEFCHLLLKNGGVCDLVEFRKMGTANQQIESFCNRFSGAFLMPAASLSSENIVQMHGTSTKWKDIELQQLATMYSVSREVVLRRLVELRMSTIDFYFDKLQEYSEQYKRKESGESGGYLDYFRRPIINFGRNYVALVLEAYYERFITASSLSDYLGVRLKHLSDIENEIWK